MIAGLDLLIALLLLYALECIKAVRPGDVVLAPGIGRGYRLRKPIHYPSERWGWVLLNPLQPGALAFLLPRPAFSFAPGGAEHTPRGELLVHERCLKPRFAGKRVELAGGTLPGCSTDAEAWWLASRLETLRQSRIGERSDATQRIERWRFDTAAIRERHRQLLEASTSLGQVAVLQFSICFLLFPALLLLAGPRAAILVSGPLLLALGTAAAILYGRAAAAQLPWFSRWQRLGIQVKLILYPVATLRLPQLLCWECLSGFDPVAVLATLAGSWPAAEMAAGELLTLRYQSEAETVDEAHREERQQYREARRQALERFSGEQSLPLEVILRPPDRSQSDARTYCPLCRSQYLIAGGACTDCPDVVLQPLSAAGPDVRSGERPAAAKFLT